MSTDLLKTIARVRRAMPRNADVMELCDALERQMARPPFEGGRIRVNEPNEIVVINPDEGTVSRFDKTAYMRDYMRKKRAKGKS